MSIKAAFAIVKNSTVKINDYFVAHPRRQTVALMLAAGLPVLVLIFGLAKYVVNVPFWDQWEMVPIIEHYQTGHLTFGDFFAQHNEHRILVVRLLWLALSIFSHWNTSLEVVASVAVAMAGFAFLWLIVRSTFTSKYIMYFATVAASAVYFSVLQYENWQWGWQLVWFVSNTCFIIAVWALSAYKASPLVKIAVAAVAAGLATYSLGDGQFVWLACLPLIWLNKDLRRHLKVWIAAAIAVIASYYIGYRFATGGSNLTTILHDPLNACIYLLTYIARPVSPDFLMTLPIALIYITGLALLVRFWFAKANIKKASVLLPWLCFGIFVFIAAVSADFARLSLGFDQSFASRYTTVSSLLLVAALMATLKIIEISKDKVVKIGLWVVIAVVSAAVAYGYCYGILQMRQQHSHLLKVQQCAKTATSENDDCLLLLYPNKKVVWQRLEYLRSIHWGGL